MKEFFGPPPPKRPDVVEVRQFDELPPEVNFIVLENASVLVADVDYGTRGPHVSEHEMHFVRVLGFYDAASLQKWIVAHPDGKHKVIRAEILNVRLEMKLEGTRQDPQLRRAPGG